MRWHISGRVFLVNGGDLIFEPITLRGIFTLTENLEIPGHMKPTYNLTLERDDMVDMVLLTGLVLPALGVGIKDAYFVSMFRCQPWRCSL